MPNRRAHDHIGNFNGSGPMPGDDSFVFTTTAPETHAAPSIPTGSSASSARVVDDFEPAAVSYDISDGLLL
jgi:hypothetical protein